MNQFIQENSVAIIGFLVLIIFLLMSAMIIILYKLLTSQKQSAETAQVITEKAPERSKLQLKKPEHIVEKFHCHHHSDQESVGSCLICEDVFCVNCLVEHESMHFCRDHFRVFANSKWHQLTDVKTTPDTPEEGLFVYNFKRDIWKEKNIPTFVMTHYKINVDNDFIESFVQLNVREEDVAALSVEIERYKNLELK